MVWDLGFRVSSVAIATVKMLQQLWSKLIELFLEPTRYFEKQSRCKCRHNPKDGAIITVRAAADEPSSKMTEFRTLSPKP